MFPPQALPRRSAMPRPASASSRRSVGGERKQAIRAPPDDSDNTRDIPAHAAPASRDAPLSLAELNAPGRGRDDRHQHSDDDGGHICACSDFHSLRCNTRVYSLLHRAIELDATAAARMAGAAAQAEAQRRHLRDLFGDDLAPDPRPPAPSSDSWSARLPSASLRMHLSDFTLGNLKNQSTRVVIPPTVIFHAPGTTNTTAEYFFTSMQTGEILRKGRAKINPQLVLEDLLRFARTNIGAALAQLGKHSAEVEQVAAVTARGKARQQPTSVPSSHAWAMEEEKYTRQLQFGDPVSAASATVAAPSNLPNYMRATKNLSSKSPLALSAAAVSATRGPKPPGPFAPGSAWATRDRDAKAQHPLTSSPSTQPAQHCDIIAQFTFASDAPRFNDPNLPYTMLRPAQSGELALSSLDPHAHPDILYLSARSLHHFLTVVQSDFSRPRARGVLQPFVQPQQEHNTVYRVSFTALPREGGPSSSRAELDPGALPPAFHISIEGRQNVLKLNDHTGLASAAAAVAAGQIGAAAAVRPQFSLSERAVTFDASHLTLQLDADRHNRTAADAASAASGTTSKTHVLYPRVPASLAAPTSPNATVASAAPMHARPASARPSGSAHSTAASASTTLVVPSSYPFSPSASTAAARLRVPLALQERLQAAILRIVAHLNELDRASAAREGARQASEAALQRELHGKAAASMLASSAASAPATPAPSITVGYLEATFKIDANNNLFLITARSIKHLVAERRTAGTAIAGATPEMPEPEVRCAQCLQRCTGTQELRALAPPLGGQSAPVLRPTSAARADQLRGPARQSKNSTGEYQTPFFARYRPDNVDEEEARARAKQSAARASQGGAMVFGLNRKQRRDGDDGDDPARNDDEDRDLWPDSHFDPPSAPASRFTAVSDRIQSNPLFDSTDRASSTSRPTDEVLIRDEEEDGDDDEIEKRLPLQSKEQHRHRLDRHPNHDRRMLSEEDEAKSLDAAMGKLQPERVTTATTMAGKARPASAAPAQSVQRASSSASRTASGGRQDAPLTSSSSSAAGPVGHARALPSPPLHDPEARAQFNAALRAESLGMRAGNPQTRPPSHTQSRPHAQQTQMQATRAARPASGGPHGSSAAPAAASSSSVRFAEHPSASRREPPGATASGSSAVRFYNVHDAASPEERAKMAALAAQAATMHSANKPAAPRCTRAAAHAPMDDGELDLSVEIEEGQP